MYVVFKVSSIHIQSNINCLILQNTPWPPNITSLLAILEPRIGTRKKTRNGHGFSETKFIEKKSTELILSERT